MKIHIKFFLFSLLFLSSAKISRTQDQAPLPDDTTNITGSVEWVKCLPPSGRDQVKKGAGEKFMEFVFGKRNTPVLTRPVAVLPGADDGTWVLDQENGIIFRFREEVGEMTHFKNKQYSSFRSLVGICSLPGNKILFTDSFWNRLFVFTPGKKDLQPLNDSLILERPTGVAWSEQTGSIWVVETNAHRVTILGTDGKIVKRFGTRGTGPGEFNYPTSLWIDHSGQAYIVDALNFRVQIFDAQGNFISMFGKLGDVTGSFARPKGIAVDSYGHIYVADALFNAVQIFDRSGRFLYTFGSQGHGEGQFWMPSGLFIDGRNNIYVADSYNSRIQVFKLNYSNH